MGMFRKLFRPGAGQKPQHYTAAFVNGTAIYRGDFVVWDTTAPASQGASGVLEGKTLGTSDFIFVTTSTSTLACGVGAGIIEGKSIGNRDTTTAMTNDNVAIIQNWGVFDTHCQVSTATAVGDVLLSYSTVAGELVGTVALAVAATAGHNGGYLQGIALTTDAAYTRGTVTTIKGCTAFVRCQY